MINKTITRESFNLLLNWLDPDPELAGEKYEKVRRRLIAVLINRGCFEAEELADEAITRVSLKLAQIIDTYEGEPLRYFYAVADNVHHEWLREQKKLATITSEAAGNTNHSSDAPAGYECMEKCLRVLAAQERELIVAYYYEEKGAKIFHRQKLAEKSGLSLNALQIKTCRIRARLQLCIKKCVGREEI